MVQSNLSQPEMLSLRIGWPVRGNRCLSDGMKEFDKEGIQELKKLAGDDLENIITRVRALKKQMSSTTTSPVLKRQTGSVRFIVETDEIKK